MGEKEEEKEGLELALENVFSPIVASLELTSLSSLPFLPSLSHQRSLGTF